MRIPTEITFRHMESSDALESRILQRVEKLERITEEILRCRVLVEEPHKHHHNGNLFQVSIEVSVPGNEFVVKRTPDQHQEYEDPYVAVRDAFNSMERQITSFQSRRRVKRYDRIIEMSEATEQMAAASNS